MVTNKTASAAALPSSSPGLRPGARRLVSLDVLRGLTVAFMILVNTAGDGSVSYTQLRHSVWNGCTLTDLVFPLFLFIMGVSMALSFEGRLARQIPPSRIALQVLRRSATIFLVGLAINALPSFHLATLRYCGVLQRIGICYLLGGLVLLYLRVPGVVATSLAAILGYWWLLIRVKVPGFGWPGINVGVLDPVGNLASYIDRALIPQAHLYHQGFYDPEGLLSTVPALATTLFGVLTAVWLRNHRLSERRKVMAMAVAAILMMGVGWVWSDSFPLNKRLWTSSYVLLTGGISIGLLALFHFIIDPYNGDRNRWTRRSLTPWLVFGTNALAAYIFSELLAIAIGNFPMPGYGNVQRFSYQLLPVWLGPAPMRSLIWSIVFLGVCFLPPAWLYRRKIFLKL